MQCLTQALLLMVALGSLDAANILAVLPLKVHSHFTISEGILTALANRGHQVIVYSPLAPKSNPNIKHVDIQTRQKLEKSAETFQEFLDKVNPGTFFGVTGPKPFWTYFYTLCDDVMAHPKIKELLDTKQKFDLVLTEALFGQESLLVFGHKFGAPSVNINSFGLWSVLNQAGGNELLTAHATEITALPFPPDMTFFQRVQNTLAATSTLLQYHYQHLPRHQQVLDRLLGDKAPRVADLVNSISLHLVNLHPNIVPVSLPPSLVPVGGIHLQDKLEPLPKDIKDFMDSGKNAIIFFSLGSVVPAHLMPPELIQTFVKVFTKLPYKVLWKTDAETIPNLPSNVKIVKWVPQQAVLAHPNLALFVTHGGLLSQLEAFNAGVPVVAIPFFGDQPYNAVIYQTLGMGRGLKLTDVNEKSMTDTILSVIGKPQFVAAAKKISDVFRHRPMSPGDTAVFWVEHVLRHGGAHLTPHARNLSFVQLQGLDVWAGISGVVLTVLLLSWFIISLLCCRKSKQPPLSKNKKKTN